MDIMDIAIAKALASGGGGGGDSAFFINVEVSWNDAINNYLIDSIDKTYAEILSAYEGGALLIAKVNDSEENMLFQISLSNVVNGNAFHFNFTEPIVDNGKITGTMAYCLNITSIPESNRFVCGASA